MTSPFPTEPHLNVPALPVRFLAWSLLLSSALACPDVVGAGASFGGEENLPAAAPDGREEKTEEAAPEETRLGDRLKEHARNFWGDGKHLVTRPFRMSRREAIGTGIFLGTLALVVASDDHILEETRWDGNKNTSDFFRAVERMGENQNILLLSGLTLAAGHALGREHLAETGALMLETQIYVNLFNSTLKGVFGRGRPTSGEHRADFDPFYFSRGSDNSFPSAHAAHSFGLATVVWTRCGKWPGSAAYALAGTVAVSRVLRGQHYLSDVMAGAALGVYVGRTLAHRREERRRGVVFMPILAPSSETVGVAVSWTW